MWKNMGNISWFLLFIWLLVPVLGESYNLQMKDQGNDEENVIDLQDLLINVQSSLEEFKKDRDEIKKTLDTRLDDFGRELVTLDKPKLVPTNLRHCADVYDQKSQLSGIYTIQPPGSKPFQVYCDMTTDGGGWTVFHRRGDYFGLQHEYFKRGWEEYKDGFGDLKTEFWIGLPKISLMTRPEHGYQVLRVDLTVDYSGNVAYAKYQNFTVEDEKQDFLLRVGSYSGNAGDTFKDNNLCKFSTVDHTVLNRNCAVIKSGGWWYRYSDCSRACLNCSKGEHFRWNGGRLVQAEMKIRPMNWTPEKI